MKMDYEVQVKDQTTNKKERVKLNMVRTASVIKDTEKSWESLKAFEVLWGSLT
nr:hypothetical protein [Pasteurella multocida]